jgi:hypothetical protein
MRPQLAVLALKVKLHEASLSMNQDVATIAAPLKIRVLISKSLLPKLT